MGKDFFGWSKRQRRCFMEGNIDLKSDVSVEDYEKREDLDEIWAKNEPHILLLDGKDSFFLAD
jgi:hypothetical protein